VTNRLLSAALQWILLTTLATAQVDISRTFDWSSFKVGGDGRIFVRPEHGPDILVPELPGVFWVIRQHGLSHVGMSELREPRWQGPLRQVSLQRLFQTRGTNGQLGKITACIGPPLPDPSLPRVTRVGFYATATPMQAKMQIFLDLARRHEPFPFCQWMDTE
jgi:hypothetical protein